MKKSLFNGTDLEHFRAQTLQPVERDEILCGDHGPVARGIEIFQRPAEYFFAHTDRIHIRRVEEIYAQFERATNEGTALFFFEHPRPPVLRAISHSAEAKPRNPEAG